MTKSSTTRLARKGKLKGLEVDEVIEKEQQELLAKKVLAVKKIMDNMKKSVGIFSQAITNINSEFKCLQFQMIQQDLESILNHIDSLETEGPKVAHAEVSLKDSEISE